MASPELSLILCSRNDAYLGNSRWRLETALNYTGDRVAALGCEDAVEVIVSDWGSDVPLRDVVKLTPAAARITSFLTVPPALARERQRDSPFAEVVALNAAARRARGRYVGRIDQDTLPGRRFLDWFLAMSRQPRAEGTPDPEATLWFANRRSIPYRLAVLCPPLHVIERFIDRYHDKLTIETGKVFYNIDVGIWMLHRRLWEESGGYDERMIYMNDMEIDMVTRLRTRYPIVNLGPIIGYDFYHLDHYHPGGSRSSSTHRKVNTAVQRESAGFCPSGAGWGMAGVDLDLSRQDRATVAASAPPIALRSLMHAGYVSRAGLRMLVDRIVYPFYPVWRRRAGLASMALRGHSPWQWPAILRKLWQDRPSAKGSVTE